MTTITLPIPESYATGLLWLIGLIAATAFIVWALPRKDKTNGLGLIFDRMGLGTAPPHIVVGASILWLIIVIPLLIGILSAVHNLIVYAVGAAPTGERGWLDMIMGRTPAAGDWRFELFKLTALTATTGVFAAFPLTLWRTQISAKQSDHADATLFNAKFNAASQGLSARRTVTFLARNVGWTVAGEPHSHLEKEGRSFTPPQNATTITRSDWTIHSVEEPDVVTRSSAIDQLERLVWERPDEAPRVASLLSVYVREHTAEVPPENPPANMSPDGYRQWAGTLRPKRNDIQKAAQTLGHLHDIDGVISADITIDLRDANLQGFDLHGLNLNLALLKSAHLQGANLYFAQLRNARLDDAMLQGAQLYEAKLQTASLRKAQCQGANLMAAFLQDAKLIAANLNGATMSGARLQGADLGEAKLQDAELFVANLRGSTLNKTQLQGAFLCGASLQGAHLNRLELDPDSALEDANWRGAALWSASVQTLKQLEPYFEELYADGRILPHDPNRPDHWATKRLTGSEFRTALHAWQDGLDDFDPSWRRD